LANQITDNRANVTTADAVTGFDDLTGGAAGTLDTEIFVQGTGSVGYYTGTSRDGLLYDYATTQDLSNTVVYIWFNCGVVGLLDTKANGGVTVRFAGNTVTDWYEVYVAGSDDFPTAVSGGWVQFAVDATEARATAVTNGWTNGTAPATTAIRYVGISTITAATMPRMVDNTWIDQIATLAANTPGIIVEGRNAGTTDWNFSDIVTTLGTGVGTAKNGPGGSIVLNTPVQFGINDTSTHGFTDTNATVLWDNQEFLPDGFYSFSALGNIGGTTNVTLGIKTGTGTAATGAQGGSISADSTLSRWNLDFDDPDVDSVGFYGVSMLHGGDFQLDDPAVEFISCIINDTTSATVSNSTMLKNTIVDANTADDVSFMFTDDLGDIKFCTFEFSDGHAIELVTPRIENQTSQGNSFSGYGAIGSTDAAIYNQTTGLVNITATDGSSVSEHTYKNGTSASTTVTAAITVTYTGIAAGTEVRIFVVSTGAEEDGVENSGTSFAATLQSGVAYNVVAIQPGYVPIRLENQTYTGSTSVGLNQQPDANFNNP
jgi:hypothetical protein